MINTTFPPLPDFWNAGGNQNVGLAGAGNQGESGPNAETIMNLQRKANLLRESLNFMRGIGSQNASSPFRNRSVESSDEDILQIVSSGISRSAQTLRDFTVDVIQLAEAQRNEGRALASTSLATTAGFEIGDHHMAIHVGDRQFDFNIQISETDTVRDVQSRLAAAINERAGATGVTATVATDNQARTSRLVLASRDTGVAVDKEPNFTISSSTGNALEILGAANITQEAQNAQFRINRGFTGALQNSRSNDVNLGFGISARLEAVGEVEVSAGRDEIGQINAFRHMVNSFNNLLESSRELGPGNRLERELEQLIRSAGASLRRLGINIGEDGRLSIDEERMEAAAANGDLERFASRERVGSNSGFMNQLTRIADNASRNPGTFMRHDIENGMAFDFTPNQMSQLNHFVGIGMLFDSSM